MRSDDRGKFNKVNNEAEWDNYIAHIDDNKRKELSKQGYGDLSKSMPCPKCGKPILRENQLKEEQEMENNPWFIHTNAKGQKEPVHAACCDNCNECSK